MPTLVLMINSLHPLYVFENLKRLYGKLFSNLQVYFRQRASLTQEICAFDSSRNHYRLSEQMYHEFFVKPESTEGYHSIFLHHGIGFNSLVIFLNVQVIHLS